MVSCFFCLNDHEEKKKKTCDVSLSNGMEWNRIEQSTTEQTGTEEIIIAARFLLSLRSVLILPSWNFLFLSLHYGQPVTKALRTVRRRNRQILEGNRGTTWRVACASQGFGKFEKWDSGMRRRMWGSPSHLPEMGSNRARLVSEAFLYIIHVSLVHPVMAFFL